MSGLSRTSCFLLISLSLLAGGVTARITWQRCGYAPTHALTTRESCQSLAFSPDGKRVLFMHFVPPERTRLVLWDLVSRRTLVLYDGESFLSRSFAFSPDGKEIACMSSRNGPPLMLVWDCASGQVKKRHHGYRGVIYYKGSLCGIDQSCRNLVNVENGATVFALQETGSVSWATLGVESGYVYVQSPGMPLEPGAKSRQRFQIFDPPNGKLLAEFPFLDTLNGTCFSKGAASMAYLDSASGFQTRWFSSDGGSKVLANVRCGGLSPDGTRMVCAGGGVTVVDVASGETLFHWPLGRLGRLSPDGRMVAVETHTTNLLEDDTAIRIYSLPPERPWATIIFWSSLLAAFTFCLGRRMLLAAAIPTMGNWGSPTNWLHPEPTRFDVTFRLFNVPVRISPGFWLVHGGIAGFYAITSGPIAFPVLLGCVLVSILLHEFGHVMVGKFFHCDGEIVLTMLGGLALGSAEQQRRSQRILVYVAGPLIQIVVAALLWIVFFQATSIGWDAPAPWYFVLFLLIGFNVGWAVFNLLPIPPLDGGQILRECIAWYRFGNPPAWEQDANWWKGT